MQGHWLRAKFIEETILPPAVYRLWQELSESKYWSKTVPEAHSPAPRTGVAQELLASKLLPCQLLPLDFHCVSVSLRLSRDDGCLLPSKNNSAWIVAESRCLDEWAWSSSREILWSLSLKFHMIFHVPWSHYSFEALPQRLKNVRRMSPRPYQK